MLSSIDIESELMRLRVALAFMLASLLFLGVALWQVQVVDAYQYSTSLDAQSIRRVRLPGMRGRILDRRGECLADNRPSYCMVIYVEELRQAGRVERTIDKIEETVNKLSSVIGVERSVTRDDISMHLRKRRPMPFYAWKDLDQRALAKWAESSVSVPGNDDYIAGVDVYVEPVRVYPNDNIASHILGFVGRVGKTDATEDEPDSYDYYLPEMEGKRGIEKVMNKVLAGEAGGKLIRVNASGFKHEEQDGKDPVSGRDVVLTIDLRIQRLAQESLDGVVGAAVVLDPRNGDVLALASSPDFDPNAFSPSVSREDWKRLTTGDKPLLNRAIAEVYPPGSIFKPVVALAALGSKEAIGATSFNCPGYFALGQARFHCWLRSGHGWIGMRKAIEQSCNAYFCQLGLKCGYDNIYNEASGLGLGRATGIELGINNAEKEATGLLPDNAWKRRVLKDSWRAGDTCNVSIGQGALNVTPLQMSVVAASLANGGLVYKPRIIRKKGEGDGGVVKGDLMRNMGWSDELLHVVRGGMYDVIQAATGTGKRARIDAVEMAGKTGTAQYGGRESSKLHTWMIVFAPYDQPRYALSMLVEEGVSGGQTVAPRVKMLMEGIFAIEHGV